MTVCDVDELLAELVNRPAWHCRAACRGMGTAAFFPRLGESTKAAKAVCEGCAVRAECLAAALETPGPTVGLWGGTTGRQRARMRRGAA